MPGIPLRFENADAACHSMRSMAEFVRRGEYIVTNIYTESMAGDDFITLHLKKSVADKPVSTKENVR